MYQLQTLFDSIELKSVHLLQKTPLDYTLDLTFHSASSLIHLTESRAPSLKRSITQKAFTQSGVQLHHLTPPPLQTSLFVQDLHLFYKSLQENTSTFDLNRLLKTYQMIHLIEDQIF